MRKLKAIANLSKQFWLHTFRRAVSKPKPGEEKAKFNEYYRQDRLVELNATERAELLNYQKCINCGTCSSVCPVYGPAAHGVYRAPESIAVSLSRSFPDYGAARDAVYNCTQCGACASRCPVGVNVPGLVMLVRRKSVQAEGTTIRTMYLEHVEAHEKCGNVYGAGAEKFEEYRKSSAEYVFFAGCAGSVLSSKETTFALELLKVLGVDFTVVSDACCGGFHRSAGMLEDDSAIVKSAIEKVRAAGTNKVITACPHGLFTMRTHPQWKAAVEAKHVVQVLAQLPFECGRDREPVTYHDPCFLGRRLGIFDEPRELIARAGAKLIEMPGCRENSVCCGSREGEFIVDARVSRAMAEDRMASARATGAGVLLTACTSCTRALSEAAGDMRVMPLAEYIMGRIGDVSGGVDAGT